MEPRYYEALSLSDTLAMARHPRISEDALVLYRTIPDGPAVKAQYMIARTSAIPSGWKRLGPLADFAAGSR